MSSNSRRLKAEKMANNSTRTRMIIAFVIVILLFLVLAFRLGYVQIIASDKYAAMAKENQTTDEILPAKRGSILDRNGKELAVSTTSYKVWLRLRPPSGIKMKKEEINTQVDKSVTLLSETLDMKKSEITELCDTDAPRVKVATSVTKDKADYIKQSAASNDISFIEVEEGHSRNYPRNAFASHVIGSVSNDNSGQSGLELEYNKYLSGVAGRWIKNTDRSGNPIPGGEEIKYEEQDGLNLVLTIDETIQYYVEKEVEKAKKEQKAEKVSCIVMDPKNGDILAMSSYPDFDLNNSTEPTSKKEKKEFKKLSDKKKTEYLNTMWRNPLTSDLYEPGSVFKLITVGSALEEGTITPNSGFHCSGSYKVYDENIKCWISPDAHGSQTVTKAVANSCNPAMMQIIQKMGYSKFYKYLELFGITGKTGIDFPGEALPLIQSQKDAGPVGLATMSFGHGLSITQLQMINAVSAYGNDGKIMKPRLVKELRDNSGNTIKKFPTKIVRQVVSEKTTKEVLKMMESVITDASTPVIDIPGYRIGAKTGTSQKIVDGQYRKGVVVGSVLAMAPIDDPKFAILVTVDEPKTGEFGSTTAGPVAEAITEEVLRYLNVEPNYSDKEKAKLQKKKVIVPKVTGMKYSKAVSLLNESGLEYSISGSKSEDEDFKIVDQYPKAGDYVKKGSKVFLYTE